MAMHFRWLWMMPAIAVVALVADLAEPGYLQFVDLPFMMRARVSQVRFDPSQPLQLGTDCQQLTQHPKLLQASVVLSQLLPGQTEQDLLTQLGPPVCAISKDTYSWALTNGMALTARVNEGGLITDVQITDRALGQ